MRVSPFEYESSFLLLIRSFRVSYLVVIHFDIRIIISVVSRLTFRSNFDCFRNGSAVVLFFPTIENGKELCFRVF